MSPRRLLIPESARDTIVAAVLAAAETRKHSTLPQPVPWADVRREEQVPPDGDWRTWFVRGGRGSGKTRTGAETLREWIAAFPGSTWAIVAPTFADARDKCIEGESGLLPALHGAGHWNRSLGELTLGDGTRVYIDGADDGAPGIQGFNLAGAWCDEVGLWRKWREAWSESIQFAVRKQPARIIATGTPKMGHPLVKHLLADAGTVQTRMRTWDNLDNLSEHAVRELEDAYGGTRLGAQELEGEYLDQVEGALWQWAWIEQARLRMNTQDALSLRSTMERVVVAVDPAISVKDGSDRTGVAVVGVRDGAAYVFHSKGLVASPHAWARHVVDVYEQHSADRIVVERNQGGDLVRENLRAVHPGLPIKEVVATRGKVVRAEPVAALYEQGRVHHVGSFGTLEDQMTTIGSEMPPEHDDEVDALVYACTELLLARRPDWSFA